MLNKRTEIIVPLMSPYYFLDYFNLKINKIFNELKKISGNTYIKYKNKNISLLEIKILHKRNSEIKKLFKESSNIEYYIKFSSSISQIESHRNNELFNSFSFFVEHYVRHLIIYLNIAKPGFFDTREGIILNYESSDKKQIQKENFPMIVNSIGDSIDMCKEYKWPLIENLPLKDTIEWLSNHWVAFESISGNKLQRALNAFSYIFHNNLNNNCAEDLFFALIGIEAIYAEGNSDIQRQVDIKSQLLLGSRKEFKKIFNELYNYRSRYIHGDLDFINKFHIEDDVNSPSINQLLKTYNKSGFAILILIASIQKHFLKNKDEFKFELKII